MPKSLTTPADYTRKQCRGCKALRFVNGEPTCGLGFGVIHHPWPNRAHLEIIRPAEPCLRPMTKQSYWKCRLAATDLGKTVEICSHTNVGVRASPNYDYFTGRKTEKSQAR